MSLNGDPELSRNMKRVNSTSSNRYIYQGLGRSWAVVRYWAACWILCRISRVFVSMRYDMGTTSEGGSAKDNGIRAGNYSMSERHSMYKSFCVQSPALSMFLTCSLQWYSRHCSDKPYTYTHKLVYNIASVEIVKL
jgi:hypothetical protein